MHRMYRDALIADGVAVETVSSATGAHEWLQDAVDAVPRWFLAH